MKLSCDYDSCSHFYVMKHQFEMKSKNFLGEKSSSLSTVEGVVVDKSVSSNTSMLLLAIKLLHRGALKFVSTDLEPRCERLLSEKCFFRFAFLI